MAEVRDMQKLGIFFFYFFMFILALKTNIKTFCSDTIKNTINNSQDVNASEIGKQCVSLDQYRCEIVENMIDIILLCRRTNYNYDDEESEDDIVIPGVGVEKKEDE